MHNLVAQIGMSRLVHRTDLVFFIILKRFCFSRSPGYIISNMQKCKRKIDVQTRYSFRDSLNFFRVYVQSTEQRGFHLSRVREQSLSNL